MSKYYVGDKIFFIPMNKETTIIKVMPKGEAGLKQDFYVVECKPDNAFTSIAIKQIIKALKQDEKINECIECRWFVNMVNRKSFCFVSNELVKTYTEMNLRPKNCIKDTEKEKLLIEGELKNV